MKNEENISSKDVEVNSSNSKSQLNLDSNSNLNLIMKIPFSSSSLSSSSSSSSFSSSLSSSSPSPSDSIFSKSSNPPTQAKTMISNLPKKITSSPKNITVKKKSITKKIKRSKKEKSILATLHRFSLNSKKKKIHQPKKLKLDDNRNFVEISSLGESVNNEEKKDEGKKEEKEEEKEEKKEKKGSIVQKKKLTETNFNDMKIDFTGKTTLNLSTEKVKCITDMKYSKENISILKNIQKSKLKDFNTNNDSIVNSNNNDNKDRKSVV